MSDTGLLVWRAAGGMESFYHVLMLHQLGQNCSELMATQRSVVSARTAPLANLRVARGFEHAALAG